MYMPLQHALSLDSVSRLQSSQYCAILNNQIPSACHVLNYVFKVITAENISNT